MPQQNGRTPGSRPARQPAAKAAKPQKQNKKKKSDGEYDIDYERSVKFANRGCAVAFLAVMLVVLIIGLVLLMSVVNEINGKKVTATGTVTFDIPAGSGYSAIAGILKENGLISNENIFKFYVRFNGANTGFQAGRFTLEAGASYDEIIEVLSELPPPREVVWVTFPEGSTLMQFAANVEQAGICTADAFLDAANNGDYSDINIWNMIDTQPNTFMKLEGYLFPDSYEFYSDETPENVVRKLLNQMQTNLDAMSFVTGEGEKTFWEMLEYRNINLREAITMASLIEEEASRSDENQLKVSGVFWNRIEKGHPTGEIPRHTLGTDVTTRYLADFVVRAYGSPNYTGWTLADMKVDMLNIIPHDVFYSYYTGDEDENSIEGLPVSPISCPGKASIYAAMQPELHNYFYFVTDAYGDFRYATYYRDHLNNIAQAEAANAKKAEEDAAASEENAAAAND